MAFAVELALSLEAAVHVREIWTALAEAGLDYMAQCGAGPHISLVLWDDVDPPSAKRALESFAQETPPIEVSLVGVDHFGDVAVYLAPAPAPDLVAVHRRFYERFGRLGANPSPYYAPGAWVPHCTLAMDFTPETTTTALAVARRARLPITGRLERIELIQYRPVQLRHSVPLAGR